jgi:hypothetical protein
MECCRRKLIKGGTHFVGIAIAKTLLNSRTPAWVCETLSMAGTQVSSQGVPSQVGMLMVVVVVHIVELSLASLQQ